MMKEDLNHVLLTLTERECGIIKMRYGLDDGEEKTLEEVGRAFNVSGSGRKLRCCFGGDGFVGRWEGWWWSCSGG
jgi:hypothetical protein